MSPRVRENCTVECSGDPTNMYLSADLIFLPSILGEWNPQPIPGTGGETATPGFLELIREEAGYIRTFVWENITANIWHVIGFLVFAAISVAGFFGFGFWYYTRVILGYRPPRPPRPPRPAGWYDPQQHAVGDCIFRPNPHRHPAKNE